MLRDLRHAVTAEAPLPDHLRPAMPAALAATGELCGEGRRSRAELHRQA